jgi:hypothetical protein
MLSIPKLHPRFYAHLITLQAVMDTEDEVFDGDLQHYCVSIAINLLNCDDPQCWSTSARFLFLHLCDNHDNVQHEMLEWPLQRLTAILAENSSDDKIFDDICFYTSKMSLFLSFEFPVDIIRRNIDLGGEPGLIRAITALKNVWKMYPVLVVASLTEEFVRLAKESESANVVNRTLSLLAEIAGSGLEMVSEMKWTVLQSRLRVFQGFRIWQLPMSTVEVFRFLRKIIKKGETLEKFEICEVIEWLSVCNRKLVTKISRILRELFQKGQIGRELQSVFWRSVTQCIHRIGLADTTTSAAVFELLGDFFEDLEEVSELSGIAELLDVLERVWSECEELNEVVGPVILHIYALLRETIKNQGLLLEICAVVCEQKMDWDYPLIVSDLLEIFERNQSFLFTVELGKALVCFLCKKEAKLRKFGFDKKSVGRMREWVLYVIGRDEKVCESVVDAYDEDSAEYGFLYECFVGYKK